MKRNALKKAMMSEYAGSMAEEKYSSKKDKMKHEKGESKKEEMKEKMMSKFKKKK
jgi:hypothetical protein